MHYRAFLFLLLVTGCTTLKPDYQAPAVILPSMVIAQAEPEPPATEPVTQRDIALYIIELRQWGRSLKAQVDTIADLLKDKR